MGWNESKHRALVAFFTFYRDQPEGYSPESVGTFMAQAHRILNTREYKEPAK